MGVMRAAGEFLGLVPPADEQFADEQSAEAAFRSGSDAYSTSYTANDVPVPTHSGEVIATGPAMRTAPMIGARNLIVDTLATLPWRVVDRATMKPVAMPPKWASDHPYLGSDPYTMRWRLFDGLMRFGYGALRIHGFDTAGYPTTFEVLPNMWCRLNAMSQRQDVKWPHRRSELVYSAFTGSYDSLYQWLFPGDPIVENEHCGESLYALCEWHPNGAIGGEGPVRQAAEVHGNAVAAQRSAALSLSSHGASNSIVVPDDTSGKAWDGAAEFADKYYASRRDPRRYHEPGFSKRKLKVVHVHRSAQEQQISEQRQLSAEEIRLMNNIPPMMFGKGAGNYGTGTLQQRNVFHSQTLAGFITCVESFLTSKMLPVDQCLQLDVSKFLRGSEVEQWAAAGRLVRDGLATPDEARMMIGMEALNTEESTKLYPPQGNKGDRDDGTEERRANAGSSTADED